MTLSSRVQFPSFIIVASIILAIACLSWGESFLKPLGVAVLLTILLSPLVDSFQKIGLRRIPSVILSSMLAFTLLGGVSWVITSQMKDLANELPKYKKNIRERIVDFRLAGKGSSLQKVQETVKEVVDGLDKEEKKGKKDKKEERSVPVIVKADESKKYGQISSILAPLLGPLGTLGLIIVYVIFMLIELPTLRNRLIRLIGYSRLPITTKALDEAGTRITRYLVIQSLLNTFYGFCVVIGLSLIGLPYALVWGFLAGFLRFIPYLGPWLAAILPVFVSLAVFSGWAQPFAVLGFFVVLELINNLILEPILYGHNAGVSELSLLIAITFWTWLWGPIGLLLATPLTVCIVVLGKYIPQLEFFVILLGDKPMLEADMAYYQRLLAKDQDEALQIIESYLKSHQLEEVYDDLFLPALYYSKRDHDRGQITAEDKQFIFQATREIVEDINLRQPGVLLPSKMNKINAAPVIEKTPPHPVKIMVFPARDETDELALLMLSQLVEPKLADISLMSFKLLFSEILQKIEKETPSAVCIGSLPPDSFLHARLMSKRLRMKYPDLKIIVGRWGLKEGIPENDPETLELTGANYFNATLLKCRDQLKDIIQAL
jgi:predicted PurR-regulated permease PerM